MITFTVPLIPAAKGRPRTAVIAGRARIFTPAATATAEREFVALAAPYAPERPLEGALAVGLKFCLPIPPSRPAWWREAAVVGRVFPRGPKDLDNLEKLVLDALTRSGQWWVDDAQIIELGSWKAYAAQPGTEVAIAQIHEPATRAEWESIQAHDGYWTSRGGLEGGPSMPVTSETFRLALERMKVGKG